MPRIAAASIEEHVQRQNARITAAARRLFARDGFHGTDIATIARAVGLARNSVYRYFANKDELLLACISEDMGPYLQRLETLSAEYPEPEARIMAWVALQYELATGPAHATMELMAEVRDASSSLQKQVRHLHTAPNVYLQAALRELPGSMSQRRAQSLAGMIGAMVLAATGQALAADLVDRPAERAELEKAVLAVVAAAAKE